MEQQRKLSNKKDTEKLTLPFLPWQWDGLMAARGGCYDEAVQSSAPCPYSCSLFANENGRREGEWEWWMEIGIKVVAVTFLPCFLPWQNGMASW